MLKIFAIFFQKLRTINRIYTKEKTFVKISHFFGWEKHRYLSHQNKFAMHIALFSFFKKLADMVIILKMTIKANVATK